MLEGVFFRHSSRYQLLIGATSHFTQPNKPKYLDLGPKQSTTTTKAGLDNRPHHHHHQTRPNQNNAPTARQGGPYLQVQSFSLQTRHGANSRNHIHIKKIHTTKPCFPPERNAKNGPWRPKETRGRDPAREMMHPGGKPSQKSPSHTRLSPYTLYPRIHTPTSPPSPPKHMIYSIFTKGRLIEGRRFFPPSRRQQPTWAAYQA